MALSIIGNISLNISFIFYMIFYFPQLLHNQIYKSTDKLSVFMHVILCIATIADLIYGFGRHMQWQYRCITIVSLISLAIQHAQICMNSQKSYKFLTLNLITLLLLTIYFLTVIILPVSYLIFAGVISQLSSFFYCIPQIIKNNQLMSTEGISFYFVLLGMILNFCDTISAWTLNWDYPSKIGSPLGLVFGFILLRQFFVYNPNKLTNISISN